MKKCVLFSLFGFVFPVFSMFAQASVTIDDYGAYFIDNGVVKRIPTNEPLGDFYFWNSYIIFWSEISMGKLFYNTENGAVSDFLLPRDVDGRRDYSNYYRGLGFFPLQSGDNKLNIYYDRMEYELDPVTLRTVSIREWGDDEIVYEKYGNEDGNMDPWLERYITRWVFIDSNTHRRYGENFYLEITLSQNLLNRQNTSFQGGVKNQFVFIINNTPPPDK